MLLRRLSLRRTRNLFCLLALNNSVPTERILTVVLSLSSEGGILRCAWLWERLEDFFKWLEQCRGSHVEELVSIFGGVCRSPASSQGLFSFDARDEKLNVLFLLLVTGLSFFFKGLTHRMTF